MIVCFKKKYIVNIAVAPGYLEEGTQPVIECYIILHSPLTERGIVQHAHLNTGVGCVTNTHTLIQQVAYTTLTRTKVYIYMYYLMTARLV